MRGTQHLQTELEDDEYGHGAISSE
jgi:hypothetical protein